MTKSITYSILLLLIFPIVILLSYLFTSSDFSFFANANFQRYIFNTITLAGLVSAISILIGTSSALLVTFFDFPGRRIFQILFFLPLAFPAYIIAFTYTHLFEYAGPIQTLLRDSFNIHYFPNIKSLGGAVFIMSSALYPYVYMLVRANFVYITSMTNTARTMGKSAHEIFREIILPLSKPAIISGAVLVTMEVVADFGTPQFLAVDTFTTGIYRTWFLLNDYSAAARLTAIILVCILFVLYIERGFRKNKIYSGSTADNREVYRWQIANPRNKVLTVLFCSLIPTLGFFIPLSPLLYWSIESKSTFNTQLLGFIFNTVSISSISALIIIFISVILIYCLRNKIIRSGFVRIASMGYAVPSSVIATGIMIFLSYLSRYINFVGYHYFNIEINCMLIGTFCALLYAYTIRFLSVSIGTLEAGFNKIPREIDWVSFTLGHKGWSTCVSVHLPMMFKTFCTAFLLVFVDVVKELSATLIIRPFNFETIATRTYDLIMDEQYREASAPALFIMLIGLVSVLIITRLMNHRAAKNY